jgi:isoquinoline 1-oxidoreductase beta subunit
MSTGLTREPLSRDSFLRIAASLGASLALFATLDGCAKSEAPVAGGTATDAGFAPNAWVRIAPDETVTVMVSKSEMGQGISTGMATMVADELDASFKNVRIEFAPVSAAYNDPVFGDMTTGGSTSTPDTWTPLRTAGATARAMLVAAAAKNWNVPAAECTTSEGVVSHAKSQRTATYGSLTADAAGLPVPKGVALKSPDRFTLIGKPHVQRLDIPFKVDGSARYGIDVTLPGMVYASIERCPVFGGTVASFDATETKKLPGVIDVVQVPSGVAVVAKNTWLAFAGRKKLAIKWNDGPSASLSSEKLFRTAHAMVETAAVALHLGHPENAHAGHAVSATYEAPFLAHAPMEPQNATADVRADGCDVWAPTQVQTRALNAAVQITGLPADKCNVHTTYLGGGFGRRLDADYVNDAVNVSKVIGKPVKVTWTREDDIQHDFYRAMSVNALTATLAPDGRIASLSHTVVAPSVARRWLPIAFKKGIDTFALDGAVNQPYDIPNVVIKYADPEHAIPVGFMRAPAANVNTFAMECFMDELAHAAGKDPVAFRLAMLHHNPRAAAVLAAAAKAGGFGKAMPAGSAQGVALCFWGGSYGALVADVRLDGANVRVERVVMAVDPGIIVNPDIVAAQVQGAIVYGLAMARTAKITIKDGRVEQNNFYDYTVMRNTDAPAIDVVIVPSKEKPTGIGELGTPPIAPAVANAIFKLRGKRVRSLPFSEALA